MEYSIKFFEGDRRSAVIKDDLEAIRETDAGLYRKTLVSISKTKHSENHGEPLTENIEAGLFCIRTIHERNLSRIFYTYGKNKTIYLICGFIKKDNKIRQSQLERTRKILKECQEWKQKNEK